MLMYHYVSVPPVDADAIRTDLSTPPDVFEAHLQFLRDESYTSISLHDLALALQTGYPLPPKPIVLTFDDGYRDHYANAFPLLVKYGYQGTFFLVTAYIDERRPEYVSWDEVVEMHRAGMEMEAHGYTHVDLRERSVEYLVWQMLGSKEAIEARIERPARFFCYPSGKYDQQAMQVAHSAGYWGAVTVNQGIVHRSDMMFEIERIRAHGSYSAKDLASALDAAAQDTGDAGSCTTTP